MCGLLSTVLTTIDTTGRDGPRLPDFRFCSPIFGRLSSPIMHFWTFFGSSYILTIAMLQYADRKAFYPSSTNVGIVSVELKCK